MLEIWRRARYWQDPQPARAGRSGSYKAAGRRYHRPSFISKMDLSRLVRLCVFSICRLQYLNLIISDGVRFSGARSLMEIHLSRSFGLTRACYASKYRCGHGFAAIEY